MDLNNLDLGAIRKLQSELAKLAEQREKQEAVKLENEAEKLLSDLRNQKEQLAKEIRELDGNCRAEEARYNEAMANLETLNSLLRNKRVVMRRLDKDLKEWENKIQSSSSMGASSIQSDTSARQIAESIHPVGAEPAHSSNVDRSIPPSQLLRPLQTASSFGATSAFHAFVDPTAISQQVAVSAEKLRIALQNVAQSSSSQPFKPGRQIKAATKRVKSVGGPSSSSSNQLSQLNQNISGNIRTDDMEFAPDDYEEDGIVPVFGQLVQLGPSLFMCTRCHIQSNKRSNLARHFPDGLSICMEYDIESMGRAHFKGPGRKPKRKKAMEGVDGNEEIEAKRGAPSSSSGQQPIERPIPIFPMDDKATENAAVEIEHRERTPVQMDIKIVANEEAPTRPTSPGGSNVPVGEENNENAKPKEMIGGSGGNLEGQNGNNEAALVIVDNEGNEPMAGNSGDEMNKKMAKFEKVVKEIEEKKGTIKTTLGGHYEV